MIKYKYAYGKDDEIVHIANLSKKSKNPGDIFICISCGKELIPKLKNDIRKKHFAHKETVSCSGETYLHNLGKKIFYEEYSKCKKEGIPFYIELTHNKKCNVCQNSGIKFNFNCYIGVSNKTYNLLDFFADIEPEKKVGEFTPDILLYNMKNENVIFVEIAVTHFSEDKKIKSSKRIIELNLTEEDDLGIIKNHLLSEKDEKVKFYNFIKEDIIDLQEQQECEKEFDLFILYKSGKCRLITSISIHQTLIELSNKSILSYDISGAEEDDDLYHSHKFQNLVSKMYLNKYDIKNCYICKYHDISSDYFDPLYCKKLKLSCGSNRAAECDNYIIDYEFVKKLRKL